jgi:hypothetical protein
MARFESSLFSKNSADKCARMGNGARKSHSWSGSKSDIDETQTLIITLSRKVFNQVHVGGDFPDNG